MHTQYAHYSWGSDQVRFLSQPEDAAKDVNLKPPAFFVASTISQRQCEGPAGPEAPLPKTGVPPVVIVSYGSSSTPTAANFHHGLYALAQPESATHVQHVRPATQSGRFSVSPICHPTACVPGTVLQTQPWLLPALTCVGMLGCIHGLRSHSLTQQVTVTYRLTQVPGRYMQGLPDLCRKPQV